MKEPQIVNIIVAFIAGLVLIGVTAWLVGPANKEAWFKKRRHQDSFFNRRGMLGEAFHFGYPRTWQGLFVTLVMYGAILSVGYVIIFLL